MRRGYALSVRDVLTTTPRALVLASPLLLPLLFVPWLFGTAMLLAADFTYFNGLDWGYAPDWILDLLWQPTAAAVSVAGYRALLPLGRPAPYGLEMSRTLLLVLIVFLIWFAANQALDVAHQRLGVWLFVNQPPSEFHVAERAINAIDAFRRCVKTGFGLIMSVLVIRTVVLNRIAIRDTISVIDRAPYRLAVLAAIFVVADWSVQFVWQNLLDHVGIGSRQTIGLSPWRPNLILAIIDVVKWLPYWLVTTALVLILVSETYKRLFRVQAT